MSKRANIKQEEYDVFIVKVYGQAFAYNQLPVEVLHTKHCFHSVTGTSMITTKEYKKGLTSLFKQRSYYRKLWGAFCLVISGFVRVLLTVQTFLNISRDAPRPSPYHYCTRTLRRRLRHELTSIAMTGKLWKFQMPLRQKLSTGICRLRYA